MCFYRELDPAMLRRLEKRILVDVPNTQAREAMFRHYLPKIVLKQPALKCDIYYEFLAKVSTEIQFYYLPPKLI